MELQQRLVTLSIPTSALETEKITTDQFFHKQRQLKERPRPAQTSKPGKQVAFVVFLQDLAKKSENFIASDKQTISIDMVGQNPLFKYNTKPKINSLENLFLLVLDPAQPKLKTRQAAKNLIKLLAKDVEPSLKPREHNLIQSTIDLVRQNAHLTVENLVANIYTELFDSNFPPFNPKLMKPFGSYDSLLSTQRASSGLNIYGLKLNQQSPRTIAV